MRKFYTCIVNHPKIIMISFAIVFVICLFCRPWIAVNYDMNDYLPEDSASTKALDTMNEEYDGGIPNARVMVQNVTVPEAMQYKEQLEAVDGVTDVTWLDDVANITQPLEFIDTDTLETYYKDEAALFSVTIDEDKRIEACDSSEKIMQCPAVPFLRQLQLHQRLRKFRLLLYSEYYLYYLY